MLLKVVDSLEDPLRRGTLPQGAQPDLASKRFQKFRFKTGGQEGSMLAPRLSPFQRARAYIDSFTEKLDILSYSADHPVELLAALCLRRSPWVVNFKDGSSESANTRREVFELVHRFHNRMASGGEVRYRLVGNPLEIRLFPFEGWNGSEVFSEEIYSSLPVRGRTVIDIGANIGDSPLYFAARGAKAIVAYEPDEALFQTALRNLSINGFRNVSLRRSRVVGDRARLESSEVSRKLAPVQTRSTQQGPADTPDVTLTQVLSSISDENLSLKMDCEGFEYEILFSTPVELLTRVRYIQLEYHYGARLLKQYLEGLGYDVRVSRPKYTVNLHEQNVMVSGNLWASIPS